MIAWYILLALQLNQAMCAVEMNLSPLLIDKLVSRAFNVMKIIGVRFPFIFKSERHAFLQ